MTDPFIRLEDARGCFKLFRRSQLDLDPAKRRVRPKGNAWQSIWFVDTLSVDPPTYRSEKPAIGPFGEPFNARLHLPEGWCAPKEPK